MCKLFHIILVCTEYVYVQFVHIGLNKIYFFPSYNQNLKFIDPDPEKSYGSDRIRIRHPDTNKHCVHTIALLCRQTHIYHCKYTVYKTLFGHQLITGWAKFLSVSSSTFCCTIIQVYCMYIAYCIMYMLFTVQRVQYTMAIRGRFLILKYTKE